MIANVSVYVLYVAIDIYSL